MNKITKMTFSLNFKEVLDKFYTMLHITFLSLYILFCGLFQKSQYQQ